MSDAVDRFDAIVDHYEKRAKYSARTPEMQSLCDAVQRFAAHRAELGIDTKRIEISHMPMYSLEKPFDPSGNNTLQIMTAGGTVRVVGPSAIGMLR